MSNFASAFTPISVTTAKDKISSTDKFILFIGRPCDEINQQLQSSLPILNKIL